MKNTKKLLADATGVNWAQMGSKFIARCDGRITPNAIIAGLGDHEIVASILNFNTVEISGMEANKITPQNTATINQSIADSGSAARPRRIAPAPATWVKS